MLRVKLFIYPIWRSYGFGVRTKKAGMKLEPVVFGSILKNAID